MLFSDLDLDPKVIKAVEDTGYTEPTPIQAEAIPHALAGRDVLGIAQTGTGKTASFTLPLITILGKGRARARMPRSLILCPTRELAAQVADNFVKYGKYHKLTMALLIGGVNFRDQDKLIDRGVDVLIATPGRLLDHFERGKLMLTGIQVMVVDEADRMLDMGFIPDIEKIFGLTPFTRQTLFFSATMPPEITRITDTFLSNPVRVEVARQATTAETVTQSIYMFEPTGKDAAPKEKRDCLRLLMEREGEKLTNAIIFCNRKRDIGVLQKSLVKHGYNAGALHGDLDQSVRTATLNGFRDGSIKFLVASDVAARGLDIPAVSHVFNFDVPTHPEDYVHRIGRTGRAGRDGTAISICAPHEKKYLGFIEEMIKREIPRADPLGEVQKPARRRTKAEAMPEAVEAPAAKQPTERSAAKKPTERPAAKPQTERPAPAKQPERAAEPPSVRPPAPASEPGRDDRGRGRRRGRDGDGRGKDHGVVGMGEHVPAFLMRPIRTAKSDVADDVATDSATDNAGEAA